MANDPGGFVHQTPVAKDSRFGPSKLLQNESDTSKIEQQVGWLRSHDAKGFEGSKR
jgi:hypothetical protein